MTRSTDSCPCCCFVQLCSNEFYDTNDLVKDTKDWATNGYCCMREDPDDLPDGACRFCNFKGANKHSTDFGFGYYGDEEGKSKKQIFRMRTEQQFRILMLVQALAFAIVGLMLLFNPESAAKNLLFNADYKVMSAVDIARQRYEALGGDAKEVEIRNKQIQTDANRAENKEISLLSNVLHSLESVLTKEDTTHHDSFEEKQAALLEQAEKTLQRATLEEAQRIAEQQPQELTVTSFASMFGAMCVAYCSISIMAYACRDAIQQSVYSKFSLVTYCCLIVALATTSTRRAAGNESTTFMIWSLVFCVLMLVMWFWVHGSLSAIFMEKRLEKEKKARRKLEKKKEQEDDAHALSVMQKLQEASMTKKEDS